MANEDIVVAVRLCDSLESEQPDPLCLGLEDLITWRHFENLLRGMYKSPPDAIRVCYLDDECDWIEVGSDAELAEAIRVTRESGEILQLQVRRKEQEKLITLDSVETPAGPAQKEERDNGQFVMYIPTTDTRGDILAPLVYPYPTEPVIQPVEPVITTMQPLVYPHIKTYVSSVINSKMSSESEETDLLGAEGHRESMSMSHVPDWSGAKNLSKEEKIRQLKLWIESGSVMKPKHAQQTAAKVQSTGDTQSVSKGMPVEPLSSESKSLGRNFIPNQDPFDIEDDATPESDQGSWQKDRSPTLMPTPVNATNKDPDQKVKFFGDSPDDTDKEMSSNNNFTFQKSLLDMIPPGPTQSAIRAAYTSAVPKCKVMKKASEKQPIPMPRNLLMMEGAQSGANAVAIEMPADCCQSSSVNKEEEIAASGGASSTSASEETGEVLARGDSVAAAIIRENKALSQAAESYTEGRDSREQRADKKLSRRSECRSKHSGCRKEKSGDRRQETGAEGGARPKTDKAEGKSNDLKHKCKDLSTRDYTKQSSSEKREKKKKDLENVTEDVESGEKVNVNGDSQALQAHQFVKHMKKVKKEIHSSIVKDVTKQVDKLLRKACVRSLSLQDWETMLGRAKKDKDAVRHEGIFCDSCNNEIIGVRFKCGNCLDFDLCEDCESKPRIHFPTHVFLKLRMPARRAGCCNGQRYSLLRENVYEAELTKPEFTEPGLAESRREMPNLMSDSWKYTERIYINLNELNHSENRDDGESPLPKTEPDPATPMVVPMTKLTAATSAPPLEDYSTEDMKDGYESPVLSDSGSSIVPISPPRNMTPPPEDMKPSGHLTLSENQVTQESSAEPPDMQALSQHYREVIERLSQGGDVLYKRVYDVGHDKEDYDEDDVPELLSGSRKVQVGCSTQHWEKIDSESSSFDDMGSDCSDDFCIIDPPRSQGPREDYELISDSEEEESPLNPSNLETEAKDVSVKSAEVESEAATVHVTGDSDPQNEVIVTLAQAEVMKVEEVTPADRFGEKKEEAAKEREQITQQEKSEKESEDAQVALYPDVVVDDGLIHKMNAEEKQRFIQLLKIEMDKEYEEERKRRAVELEQALKLQKEKEFQMIMEAKEREAAFENEKLEWAAQQKKEEERLSRQTSVSSVGTPEETSLTLASELEGATERSTASNKKNVDCQTVPEPVSPASHIIHNVASGVSRAAATAFCTAKDVFYSLQAKQSEWKAAPSTYKPPQSNWKPPANNWKPPTSTWSPPKDDYIPPTSNWTPSKCEFIPPNIEWISKSRPIKAERSTPVENEATNPEGAKGKESEVSKVDPPRSTSGAQQTSRRSSSSSVSLVPTLASLEVADTALRRELLAMQHLVEMGFANREKNRQLLNKFDYNLEKVVQSLLQEEGEAGDHWSFHRH